MNKFKVTAVYEVETEHEIFIDGEVDKEKVTAIAKSIAEAGEENLDSQTALELSGLSFTYMPIPEPVTEDCLSIDEPMLEEVPEHDGQP